MKALVIFDVLGNIYNTLPGYTSIPKGLESCSILVEIPEGKYAKNVDTTTDPAHPVAVIVDLPKTDTEQTISSMESMLDYIMTEIVPAVVIDTTDTNEEIVVEETITNN